MAFKVEICLGAGVWLGLLLGQVPLLAQSVIVPDDTLGGERSAVEANVLGANEVIRGGARRGQNLFHSFREFNVEEGRGAYFLTPDAEIQNIFARVTGGNRSDIMGFLGTRQDGSLDGTNANLFLINPNGILFGRNARLDMNGSFVGTTANAIGFGSESFSTIDPSSPADSDLLKINPSAFLFSQFTPGAGIQNQSTTGVSVVAGESLLLVGGDVSFDGATAFASGGRIEVGGLSQPGSIGLTLGDTIGLSFPVGVGRSDVSLANGSVLNTAAIGGGDIAVVGRDISLTGTSGIFTGLAQATSPTSQSGNIEVNATRNLSLSDGSSIGNLRVGGVGSTGMIDITAENINLRGKSAIATGGSGAGGAGTVSIRANNALRLEAGSGILSTVGDFADTVGAGKGGDLFLSAQDIFLTGTSFITTANLATQGEPGNIRVAAGGSLDIGEASRIFADSSGSADSGSLTVDVPLLNIASGGSLTTSTSGQGNGGDLGVNADTINITGGTEDGQGSSGIRDCFKTIATAR
jgi:filamentous hemagglutinin family protein